jgi:hypothetical protein
MARAISTNRSARGDKVAYVCGNVKEIRQGERGILNLDNRKEIVFLYGKEQEYRLAYQDIKVMEFCHNVTRTVGWTIALGGGTLGIGVSPSLTNSRHYLTISFTDGCGNDETMVLDLGEGRGARSLAQRILDADTSAAIEMSAAVQPLRTRLRETRHRRKE